MGLDLLKSRFSLSHLFRHTTAGMTALDEGSACRRDVYMKTHARTHTQKGHPWSRRDFFVFALCTLSVLLSDCPGLCVLFLLNNTHNTNIHAAGRIRTPNPSKRLAADPRLRPLAHRDREICGILHNRFSLSPCLQL